MLHAVRLCRRKKGLSYIVPKLVIYIVVRGYNLVYMYITDPLFVFRSTDISMSRNREIMKNAIFWDVAPCGSCVNRPFGGRYRLHFQGRKIRGRGTNVWLQTVKRRFGGRYRLHLQGRKICERGTDVIVDSHKIYMAPHPGRWHSS
jgi:hypothetical protein